MTIYTVIGSEDWTDYMERGPYTHYQARIELYIRLSDMAMWLDTRYNTGSMSCDEFNGKAISLDVICEEGSVDGPATLEMLNTNPEIQGLFDRIGEGYIERYNGNNYTGGLDPDASDALNELSKILRDCPSLPGEAGIMYFEDWYNVPSAEIAEHYGITADTTDDEIMVIVKGIEDYARSDYQIVLDADDVLMRIRDEIREDTGEKNYDRY